MKAICQKCMEDEEKSITFCEICSEYEPDESELLVLPPGCIPIQFNFEVSVDVQADQGEDNGSCEGET